MTGPPGSAATTPWKRRCGCCWRRAACRSGRARPAQVQLHLTLDELLGMPGGTTPPAPGSPATSAPHARRRAQQRGQPGRRRHPDTSQPGGASARRPSRRTGPADRTRTSPAPASPATAPARPRPGLGQARHRRAARPRPPRPVHQAPPPRRPPRRRPRRAARLAHRQGRRGLHVRREDRAMVCGHLDRNAPRPRRHRPARRGPRQPRHQHRPGPRPRPPVRMRRAPARTPRPHPRRPAQPVPACPTASPPRPASRRHRAGPARPAAGRHHPPAGPAQPRRPAAWPASRTPCSATPSACCPARTGLASYLRTQLTGGFFPAPSLPLDLGEPTEQVPPHLRRAVTKRDRHCSFPGCTAPPVRCHVHHVIPRSKGGPTRLDNLTLLCMFHHLIAVHRWGWTLHLHADGTTTAISPDGTKTLHSHSPPPGQDPLWADPPAHGPPATAA